jgi:hypothetical protein
MASEVRLAQVLDY